MTLSTLTRWEPFRDLLTIHDRMNRLFGDSLSQYPGVEAVGAWIPPVDIHEETDRLVFIAEVPGVSKDDIEIKVENGNLVIRGEKKQEAQLNDESAHRVERFYGSFSRSFSLPTTINADAITAKYKDGVLQIVLPKSDEAKPKKISILSA